MKVWATCLFLMALPASGAYMDVDCNGVQCAEGAECVNNKCQCSGDTPYGFGPIYCYETPSYICALTSDPVVKVMDQANPGVLQKTFLHFPAHFLVALLNVERPNKRPCQIAVLAQHSKYKAKIYVSRLEFYLIIGSYQLGFQVDAPVSEQGLPQGYDVSHKYSVSPSVAQNPGYPDDQSVVQTFQEEDFVVVICEVCGVRCKFRAYNHTERHQVTSGAVIVVDTSNFPDVFYRGSVCLPPSHFNLTLEKLADIYNIDPEYVVLHRVITNDVLQLRPRTECETKLKQTVQACELDRRLFYQQSHFVFGNAAFLRCFCQGDPTAADAVCLMSDIAMSICTRNQAMCLDLQEQLSNVHGGLPCPGSEFLSFDCTQLA